MKIIFQRLIDDDSMPKYHAEGIEEFLNIFQDMLTT